MKKFSLEGKVILVTGASSGIGRGCAMLFAESGAKVFVTARREQNLKDLKQEIEAVGGVAEYAVCDITSEEQCKASVEACIRTFGRLDGLVNSAGMGYSPSGFEEEFSTELFDRVINTNLRSVFFMTKYAAPEMGKCGAGAIVNISSLAAIKGHSPLAYTASKGGILSLTKMLGRYLADKKIRVNTIYPGSVRADMTEHLLANEDIRKMLLDACQIKRIGEPEDIAYGALYLISDASSWVTGQHLVIDGGETCV